MRFELLIPPNSKERGTMQFCKQIETVVGMSPQSDTMEDVVIILTQLVKIRAYCVCMLFLQAVHSNVRSFLCEICGSAFKTRAVQRKHVLTIHKNPKAFSCSQCSRKFNTKYALRRHMKQHR